MEEKQVKIEGAVVACLKENHREGIQVIVKTVS